MADHDASQKPMYWGPAGPPANRKLVDSWTPGRGDADSWGPYHHVLFRPHKVTPWIRFKTMTTGVNIARRLWDEREALRADYEAAHGEDPEHWPVSHPGVVLETVPWVAHAACVGCQWLDRSGMYMRDENWRAAVAEAALQHQNTPE
jgi:hypothetical protein